MMQELALIAASVGAMLFAVYAGPVRLVCRAVLRKFAGTGSMRRWQGPVCIGLSAGLVGACLFAGLHFGGRGSALAALLALLGLLAIMDLAWRWLPFEWTVPLLGLGGLVAVQDGNLAEAGLGLLLGAGVLLALQLSFRIWRGIEALGTGDIWLAAGLGVWVGPIQISWILCLAAVTALGAAVIAQALFLRDRHNHAGVAYGAHLCLAYLVFLIF